MIKKSVSIKIAVIQNYITDILLAYKTHSYNKSDRIFMLVFFESFCYSGITLADSFGYFMRFKIL